MHPAGGKVTVSEGRDDGLQLLYRGREVTWQEIAAPAAKPKSKPVAKSQALEVRKPPDHPPADPPWRKPGWIRRPAAQIGDSRAL